MEAQQHYGKIVYVVKASGFQAPPPKPTWAPIVVDIKGGAKRLFQLYSVSKILPAHRSVSLPGDGFLEVILD